MSLIDRLSHLLKMITIAGQLEYRCTYGAPRRVDIVQSAAHEILYHIVLKGRVARDGARVARWPRT
jgi:AraC family transcriptional regulator, activator of mtrCDE